MRRSAAPSQQLSSKKIKFCPPLLPKNDLTSHENHATDSVSSIKNNEHVNACLKKDVPLRATNEILNLIDNSQENFKCNENSDPIKHKNHIPDANQTCSKYYSVMWCKLSTRKHKKWEGDGILIVNKRSVILQDVEGKEIGKAGGYKEKDLEELNDGSNLKIGIKEIEILNELKSEDYLKGKCFQSTDTVAAPVQPKLCLKPFNNPSKVYNKTKETKRIRQCPFRIDAPYALVMPRPSASHQWQYNKNELQIVDVVVDPHLSQKLRPHQRDGVLFLYECIMGFRISSNFGAILADDMGLGKTLQCISVIWTLLKQGPYGGFPMFKKILIITPSSLVKNWMKEFRQWLGTERISVHAVDQSNKVENFIKSKLHSVLIISYELFVRSAKTLEQTPFDLVICDEGHRLKNTSIKTTSVVCSLKTKRRIVLTGTPIQNDLQEFFSIVEFCNPGILGSSSCFHKVYEDPIIKSNEPSASIEMKELGEKRAAELNRLVRLFTLRRTSEVINKYLPSKVEMVVMCKPSKLQISLYKQLISSSILKSCLNGVKKDGSPHLVCIDALKKLCNHPSLIYQKSVDADKLIEYDIDNNSLFQDLLTSYPEKFDQCDDIGQHSGKMMVVSKLLDSLHKSTTEKIVLVSLYSKTLDLFEKLCKNKGYEFLRLDGSTPTSQRQSLVDTFNNHNSRRHTIFLLSSKAGGVGLNLVGASRILLYDIDWNPATDLQAMARVWRDGQKRKVYVYRLLLSGSIEEKIYQRQISKQGISGSVVDLQDTQKVKFSLSELKDIFTFQEDCMSSTHDSLDCTCDQTDGNVLSSIKEESSSLRPCQLGALSNNNTSKKISMAELMEWHHIKGPHFDSLQDSILKAAKDHMTFVFENKVQ